jgi:hypothetical protein
MADEETRLIARDVEQDTNTNVNQSVNTNYYGTTAASKAAPAYDERFSRQRKWAIVGIISCCGMLPFKLLPSTNGLVPFTNSLCNCLSPPPSFQPYPRSQRIWGPLDPWSASLPASLFSLLVSVVCMERRIQVFVCLSFSYNLNNSDSLIQTAENLYISLVSHSWQSGLSVSLSRNP